MLNCVFAGSVLVNWLARMSIMAVIWSVTPPCVASSTPEVLQSSHSPAQQNQSQDHIGKTHQSQKQENSKGTSSDTAFSDAVVDDLLQRIANGLEGHNPRLLLSAFDANRMDAYHNFADGIDALFEHYDSFRIHFQIDQTTTEGERGIAQVQIEFEETPASDNARPVRKSGELRFEMERGKKGWKIVDVKPRSFFE